jgi:hypothetical protein
MYFHNARNLGKSMSSVCNDLDTLSIINHGHEGYSREDLLKGKKFDDHTR